jgi:hypothetical protein
MTGSETIAMDSIPTIFREFAGIDVTRIAVNTRSRINRRVATSNTCPLFEGESWKNVDVRPIGRMKPFMSMNLGWT